MRIGQALQPDWELDIRGTNYVLNPKVLHYTVVARSMTCILLTLTLKYAQ